MDINSQPEERDFNSVLTLRESAELCISKHPQTMYFRLPLPEDKAPEEKVKSMPPGGSPRNSWRGVPPGSLNPDPISDQKRTPVFRPGL